MCQLWQIKENIKYNPFDDISISFNPLYVKENSHNKFTSFHWLICNAEWKFFNSFWLLKQNTFSQSCANSVTKSKRTLLKNGWSTAVECLNSLRTWRSRGHFKSKKDYYCVMVKKTRAELSPTMPYHTIISESKTNQLLRINLCLSLLCKQRKYVHTN